MPQVHRRTADLRGREVHRAARPEARRRAPARRLAAAGATMALLTTAACSASSTPASAPKSGGTAIGAGGSPAASTSRPGTSGTSTTSGSPTGSASPIGPPCQTPATMSPAMADATTGVTATSVTVGNISTVGGPVPGLFQGAAIGVEAYFASVNASGGVNGRTLKVHSYDDAFNSQQNQAETAQAVAGDFALVGDFSLLDSYGCKTLAANPAMADVSVTLDPGTNNLPNVFSAQPLAQGWNLGLLDYFKTHYPKDTTVGTLVSNTATAIAQWKGQQAALVHAGYKIGYVRDISPLESNFTTDVINMRNAGVNAVVLSAMDWQVAAILVQDMAQQGWRPPLIFSSGPVYADQFIGHAGGASVANGIWTAQAQALYLGQDAKVVPSVGTFLSWVKKVNPSWTPDLFTLYGWASAELFVQALRAAGSHPTRGALLAQLKKITSFDAGGLLAPTDPAAKQPSNCYLLARIEGGTFQRVADPPGGGFRCATFYVAPGSAS